MEFCVPNHIILLVYVRVNLPNSAPCRRGCGVSGLPMCHRHCSAQIERIPLGRDSFDGARSRQQTYWTISAGVYVGTAGRGVACQSGRPTAPEVTRAPTVVRLSVRIGRAHPSVDHRRVEGSGLLRVSERASKPQGHGKEPVVLLHATSIPRMKGSLTFVTY